MIESLLLGVPVIVAVAVATAWILRRALVDGWTSREIAGALGSRAALGAVQAMVCRARRRLERFAEGERL